jgi:hypothetical protein
LLDELAVLAPQHAHELLQTLEDAGLLRMQEAAPAAAAAPPASALAACFAPGASVTLGADAQLAGGGAKEGEAPGRQRFYFVAPGACFAPSRVLPPQALLPLKDQAV